MSVKVGVSLPKKSFCGIDFGHHRWFRHLGTCAECSEKWEDYKEREREKSVRLWNKKCECGCGKLAAFNKRFTNGHSVQTDERRRRRSDAMLENNPMWSDDAKKKISKVWTGRKRPGQSGEKNSAKRDDVRRKISENNPMKNVEYRKKQRAACLTDKEVKRRSAVMKRVVDGFDSSMRERITETYTKRLAAGGYHIRNRWKTGWYARVNGQKEWYDSSYELSQMQEYDKAGINWTKKHGIRIPYVSAKGLLTYYVPDFLVRTSDGNMLVEVKGWLSESARLKARVAIEYCRTAEMKYLFLLGKSRSVCPGLSFGVA